jgi:dTDP-L-rhamnose 4-epimerase
VDALVHLAAETGTGQSMYSASYHFEVNTVGTAMVLEEATAVPSLQRMVLASSRAVYGEGAYTCAAHGFFAGESRRREDLAKGLYDVRCPKCEQFGTFALTPEHATLSPQSIYGVSKYDLEKTTHMIVRRADQQASVMRFQNVYGPGQSLINPYTGILAIFSSLAKRNEEILVFEDGDETRDFVFIDDTVASIATALRASLGGVRIFNVGAGVPVKVVDVAQRIAAHFQSTAPVTISRFSRAGDIRHNGADMTRTRKELGFDTKVRFEDGLKRFLDWTMTQNLEALAYRKSLAELEKLGAVIRADAS